MTFSGRACRLAASAFYAAQLTSCAAPHKPTAAVVPPPAPGRYLQGPPVDDPRVPPFANAGWAPFARDGAVAIALREWRLFGQKVDDAPPDNRPPPLPEDKPERQDGFWQRVGEYWWESQDPGAREASYTGMHDENGVIFPASEDGNYAWSAAFISYVMRIAGAGRGFPYAPTHSTYINAAAAHGASRLQAFAPPSYAPQMGDLICTGRASAHGIRFADLPTAGSFPSHCDIVVAVSVAPPGASTGEITVIGGNVDDAVTEKHVPVTAGGTLAGPDGTVLDTRYSWFVVLKVLYDPPPAAPAPPVPTPVASNRRDAPV